MAAYRRAPASPLTSENRPCDPGRRTPGPVEPRLPGPAAGPLSYPDAKIAATNGASCRSAPATNPDERSGLVRLAFALVTVFGGIGALLYLCAWIVIPEEGGDGASIAETFVNKRRS
ncbi:MAG: PspC domain-containing protein [Streptosporangiaceae bacterium]